MGERKPLLRKSEEPKGRSGRAAVPQEEKAVRGKLITISQAAEKTGLGKDWFYTHMNEGNLPFPWFMLTPGKRLMDSADIEEFLRQRKVPAGCSMLGN